MKSVGIILKEPPLIGQDGVVTMLVIEVILYLLPMMILQENTIFLISHLHNLLQMFKTL